MSTRCPAGPCSKRSLRQAITQRSGLPPGRWALQLSNSISLRPSSSRGQSTSCRQTTSAASACKAAAICARRRGARITEGSSCGYILKFAYALERTFHVTTHTDGRTLLAPLPAPFASGGGPRRKVISSLIASLHSVKIACALPDTLFTFTMQSPIFTCLCGWRRFHCKIKPPVMLSTMRSSPCAVSTSMPSMLMLLCFSRTTEKYVTPSANCRKLVSRACAASATFCGLSSTILACSTWGWPLLLIVMVNSSWSPAEAPSGSRERSMYTSRPKDSNKLTQCIKPYPSRGEKLFKTPR
mmetsp:Transcript_32341/g.94630  ORF Transcript_32341/g.94630 Transcript_32341/m.94630 type:complete len:298 (+) Transcript_32341:702-1595(+)